MTTLLAESPTSRRTLHLRREAPVPHAPIVVMAPESVAPAAAVAHPLDSATLLGGEKTVQIAHNGFIYKLQATKLGKLILTK